MVDIAEGRLRRAVANTEKFEVVRRSSRLTTTRRTNTKSDAASIMLVVPRDLYDSLDDMHQKTWRGDLLTDGSLLFTPSK